MDPAVCAALTDPWFDASSRAFCAQSVTLQQQQYARTLQQCAQERQSLFQNGKPPAEPQATKRDPVETAAEAAHIAAEAFHVLTGIAEILNKEIPFAWELAGWGAMFAFSPYLVTVRK
jgi:hypothetical protein